MKILEKKTYFVYIAGPLVGGSKGEELITNVKGAITEGVSVCAAAYEMPFNVAVYIPHLSLLGALSEDIGREFWRDLSFRWIEKCDVLLRMDGYSQGASEEVKRAKELSIPVDYSVGNVLTTLKELWDRDKKTWRL